MKLQKIEQKRRRAFYKYVLAASNMSQRQFAAHVNRREEWISRVMSGKAKSPYIDRAIENLAEAMHAS